MAQATDDTTTQPHASTIRERALCLAGEAARESDYARRRELEAAAMACWRAARAAEQASRQGGGRCE